MKSEIWDASLLYSQVDKEMKDAPLGEMARYKNAKLSYYKGDFEWAQSQLKVLKNSTSQLIANDAVDLFLKITDNEPVDSIPSGLKQLAKAELLAYQNKDEEALVEIDNEEVPIMDGSAQPFVEALLQAGIETQDKERIYFTLRETIRYYDAEKGVEMMALPADEYRLTVMVDYNSPVLGSQHASIVNLSEFKEQLSEVLVDKIEPISLEIKRLLGDQSYLDKILIDGAEKANLIASKKIKRIKEIVGF